MPEVMMIPASIKKDHSSITTEKLRVAAYCRVSTDQEEQLTSYEAQKSYYIELINNNPDWTLVKVFADEGITGTQAQKRPGFMEMIGLCEAGEIDLVLTKSISRFSRNIVDCVSFIRKLKALRIPILFEKENINTMDAASEMLITMLGSFAQAESESISKNVQWGKRKAFKDGKVTINYGSFLGYRKGADGQPEIVPEEAEIVRKIYRMYLAGYSCSAIKKALETEGVLTKKGKSEWSAGMIKRMLRNEKYVGDALLQKTYVADCIEHRVEKNNGELPQYYVRDNHPAIIEREMWNRVQAEIARRGSLKTEVRQSEEQVVNRGRFNSKYALANILVCGDCGASYRRITWSRQGYKKIVWRCLTRLEKKAGDCPSSISIEETVLHEAIMRAINSIACDRDELIDILHKSLEAALIFSKSDTLEDLQQRLADIERRMLEAIDQYDEYLERGISIDDHIAELSDEATILRSHIENESAKVTASMSAATRIQRIFEEIEACPMQLDEYNDSIVRQLIEKIVVNSEAKSIEVQFIGGMTVTENLE